MQINQAANKINRHCVGLGGLITGLIMITTGCTSNSNLYYWGNYEPMIYKMYNKPGQATPQVQIERLNVDIQQAENNGKPVHPGLHAHLGMMYAAVGNISDAMASFEQEKALFPESAVLIDGMMNRATNGEYKKLNNSGLATPVDTLEGAK